MPPISKNSILDRWASLMLRVVHADADVETTAEWARHVHLSVGTLREACRAAGVPCKRSLDLARVLRAIVQLQGHPWTPEAVLNSRDPRTLRALLSRTGCRGAGDSLTLEEFLNHQTVIPGLASHLLALRRTLTGNSGSSSDSSCLDIPPLTREATSNLR